MTLSIAFWQEKRLKSRFPMNASRNNWFKMLVPWALERNGRCAEALPYSRRALRLGTHDALKYFHRGMIERCLGHESRSWFAKAVRLNPHFSILWSPLARRYAS